MKILHVIPALTKGGAERVAVDLANECASLGHQVSLLAAYPVAPAWLQDDLDPAVELKFVRRSKSRFGAYGAGFAWLLRNWSWVAAHDVVHCHLTFGSLFGEWVVRLRAVARHGRRPTLVETYHAVGMNIPDWKRALHARLLRHRDGVVLMALDGYWERWRSANRGRVIEVIPNGVAPRPEPAAGDVAAYRVAAGLPDGAILIGSIGRLLHERRPDALLEAFAAATAELPENVHLVLGGEGPERAALRIRAAALGLGDRVHLPGLVHKPGDLLASLDLYLTVNVGGTTGIAAIEAAMSGLPVVAFQMDPAYRAAAGDWIWSSNDIAGLGARIAGLIGDKAEREATAKRQSRHARAHHSADTMAKAYLAFYKSALRGPERTKDADQR